MSGLICQKCGEAEVVWLHSKNGKPVLCDAGSVTLGEERYDQNKHSCHWETCSAKPEGQERKMDGPAHCKDCQEEIVWMPTKKGKKVPVQPSTYHGEVIFNDWVNKCHWDTCAHRKLEQPPAGEGVTFTSEDEIPF